MSVMSAEGMAMITSSTMMANWNAIVHAVPTIRTMTQKESGDGNG